MADFIKHNRAFAACALAVIVLAGLFLGVNRSVSSLRSRTQKLYSEGSGDYGVPEDDVAKMAGYARHLYAVTDSYGCSSEGFSEALAELESCVSDPVMVAGALERTYSAASLSYNKMNASDAEDSAKNSAKSYFYEITSVKMRLANNEKYNSAAKKYNSALAAPLSFLVTGSKSPAAVFN